jgi:transcriptional regulator GlxA family with amidase domain
MKLAYIIFDGITWLDMIGIYDPLGRLRSLNYLPDLEWDICSLTTQCHDPSGLGMIPTKIQQPLSGYDGIIVPGGHGTRKLQFDPEFVEWIRTAENSTYKISICTGSLILGAAGFLKDKRATTNFAEYVALKPYCKTVIKERIVEDGNTITAGAVTASIDLGLYLCKKWAGAEAAEVIRGKMDYRG